MMLMIWDCMWIKHHEREAYERNGWTVTVPLGHHALYTLLAVRRMGVSRRAR